MVTQFEENEEKARIISIGTQHTRLQLGLGAQPELEVEVRTRIQALENCYIKFCTAALPI